jgi:hypothetical protein
MQISGVSLVLTWPCRLCLPRFLLCMSPCYKLSLFQALRKVTLHPRCQACVFIYSSCGRWVFPPLLCSSPPTSAFTSFPAPDYWVVLLLLPATMFVYSQRLSSLPDLFIYSPGKDSLPTIFGTQCAPPSFLLVLFVLIPYYSVSLFCPWVEVSLSRGLCFSGPGFSVGVLWYHEAHVVCVFPSRLGAGNWRLGSSLFLHLT